MPGCMSFLKSRQVIFAFCGTCRFFCSLSVFADVRLQRRNKHLYLVIPWLICSCFCGILLIGWCLVCGFHSYPCCSYTTTPWLCTAQCGLCVVLSPAPRLRTGCSLFLSIVIWLLIPTVKEKSPSRYIPRYSTPSAAGYSVPLDGDDFEMILVDDTVPADADFAVGIQGNSMSPYIHDGDTVYVKKDCDLSVGDIGIFCVDGAMYCKQYYIDERNNLTLVSLNPRLRNTNVYISSDSEISVRCYGRVLLDCKIEVPDYIFE